MKKIYRGTRKLKNFNRLSLSSSIINATLNVTLNGALNN